MSKVITQDNEQVIKIYNRLKAVSYTHLDVYKRQENILKEFLKETYV